MDFDLDDLVANGTMIAPLAAVLKAIVRARYNVVISGGPNTGKTQTLRALAKAIPPRERLVTIEDAFELDLDADHVAHPNVGGVAGPRAQHRGRRARIDMAELVRWGLRMSPDRVIVGEARGARGHPAAQRHVAGQRRVAWPRCTPRRPGRRSPAWRPTRCRRRNG